MEPVGVIRMWAVILASHTKGGESLLRASGAVREAISLRENLKIRHAEIDARVESKKKSQMWENSHFRSLGFGRLLAE